MVYSLSTGLAIYFVVWWLVLFAVLPFGVRSQAESDDELSGTDPGAPIKPQMGRKLIWTTIVSAVIFGIGMAAAKSGFLTVERLSKLMGIPL
jgi:predicted secreted protein